MEPSTVRVARDQRGERTPFEAIEVGTPLGPLEWTVTPEMLERQCRIDEDYHEWYSVESPFGGRIAPILASYAPVRFLFSDKYNIRGLLVGFECEHTNPIRLDKKMIVAGRLADKYVKRDREYFVVEATCVDEDGLEIFRTRRTHVLDYIPRSAPREGYGLDSGVLKEPTDDRRH
jgi:hypothetical protein